ncbi:MAG: hypothetical protein Fur0016_21070 [Anaerolineales bacterium]
MRKGLGQVFAQALQGVRCFRTFRLRMNHKYAVGQITTLGQAIERQCDNLSLAVKRGN